MEFTRWFAVGRVKSEAGGDAHHQAGHAAVTAGSAGRWRWVQGSGGAGRRVLLAVTVAVAFAALFACGGDDASSQARRGFAAWQRAVADGDGPGGCALLTAKARMQFAGTLDQQACERQIKRASEFVGVGAKRDAWLSLKIARIDVRGDRAFIDDRDVTVAPVLQPYKGYDDYPTVLKRVGQRWQLDDLG
jgi:hypothetical protein